jgi:hypothetical protein
MSDQQAIIDGVEFALDWGLDVPEEDLEAYFELIKEREDDEVSEVRR